MAPKITTSKSSADVDRALVNTSNWSSFYTETGSWMSSPDDTDCVRATELRASFDGEPLEEIQERWNRMGFEADEGPNPDNLEAEANASEDTESLKSEGSLPNGNPSSARQNE
jgi:hypothetical protein